MEEQAQQTPQNEESSYGAEVAAVLAVLAAGPPLVAAVKAISVALKVPGKWVLAMFSVIKYKPGKKVIKGDSPLAAARRKNQHYRAAYLVKAIHRLRQAPDLKTGLAREKKLLRAHLQASKRRMDAAKKSLAEAALTDTRILGWGGILDERTTPDCRWLIGKNFSVDNPPQGLYPGARHMQCRCYPTAPYPGKPVVANLPPNLGGKFWL